MKNLIFFSAFFALIFYTNASKCVSPKVTASIYTTPDATVLTNIAFVTEFSLECSQKVSGINLYAEIDGKIIPTARISDKNDYQVSWTEDVNKARSRDYTLNLFDEEGYANWRKAQRSGEDGASASVQPLATVIVNYPGSYHGPWLNSEFIAAVLSVFVWYLAFSAKSKLLA